MGRTPMPGKRMGTATALAVAALVALGLGAAGLAGARLQTLPALEEAAAQTHDLAQVQNQNDAALSPARTKADAASDALPALDYCAHVPELLQYPEMSAGCEVYALTAVLRALGCAADPHVIVAEHLPLASEDDDPAAVYAGDPYSYGEGLPPALVTAGNSYLEQEGLPARFANATGASFEELLAETEAGRPVLVWTTMYFADPGFFEPLPAYTFYNLEHCVVLLGAGENAGTVRCMDPMSGYMEVDAAWFRTLYELCGSMATIVG
ncbi:MAG TPA: C39 family peptidase [Candidatus Aphodovivens avistercoris]|nr:C39 family peptidase [Candidatus Aphodovivens avistercoris]